MDTQENLFKLHAEAFHLTPDEEELLQLHEPKIEFKVIPYRGLSEGRQSRISVLEYKTGNIMRHVMWKRMGASKNLTHEEASLLHSHIRPYKKSLEQYGWHVPTHFYTGVIDRVHGAQIFSYEKLIEGGDAEQLLINQEEPNFLKWAIIRKVLERLSDYPQKSLKNTTILGRAVTLLPHGLDLKPANIVLNENGSLYFVDLFCPKELDENGDWLTYNTKLDSLPEDNLRAVCASREGAILRFLRLSEKSWASGSIDISSKLQGEFIEIITSLNIPRNEKDFLVKEIELEYPWLDQIYKEFKV